MNASLKSFRTPYDGWTTDDLDQLPVDGIRRELVDGVLLVTPSPVYSHQYVAGLLYCILKEVCPPTLTACLGVEIRINRKKAFIPDVMVVTRAAAEKDPRTFTASEVVLAAEIVSPTSISIDRVLKPSVYAGVGIGGYWRIEPTENYRLHAYDLPAGSDVYAGVGEFESVVSLQRPWPIEFDLDDIRPA
jgi:Uma2 family endonuclease